MENVEETKVEHIDEENYVRHKKKDEEPEAQVNRKALDESKKILESKMDVIIEINNELQNKIDGFEEEKKKIIEQKNLENQQSLDQLKQKVLEFIKNSNKSNGQLSMKSTDLSSRLNTLHNNQLLCELEFQSLQIEDLLKQREQLDKIIMEQKHDIKVHREVEKVLTEKNKKYTDMIKVLSNKIDEMNSGNISKNKFNLSSSKSFSKDSKSANGCVCPNCGSTININNRHGDKIVLLQKELIQRQKEIESLKMNYDTAKSKLNFIEKKYSNIFSLFETVLEKSFNDPKFKKNKEIFINLDDYKKCEFENLPSEEKYSLALMIMKYIVPLVNEDMTKSENYSSSIQKIKTKFFMGKDDSTNTFTSLNETGSLKSTNGLGHFKVKSISDFKKKNPFANFHTGSAKTINSKGSYYGGSGNNTSSGLPNLGVTSYKKSSNFNKIYSVLKV